MKIYKVIRPKDTVLVTILKNELGEVNLDKYGIKIQDGAVIKLDRKNGTKTTKN